MRWPRIIFLLLIAVLLGAFLHYTLPQREIVRIVDAQPVLTDVSGISAWFYASGDSGTVGGQTQRDIRFISTVRPDESPLDFRNEDTGFFGWPPYFKIDSQDLQTEAQDLRSDRDNPIWVVVTHYGWRNNLFSSYPNALAVSRVEGPDVTLFPWPALISLLIIGLVFGGIWWLWERFEDRVLEPVTDRLLVRWAKTKDWMSGRR